MRSSWTSSVAASIAQTTSPKCGPHCKLFSEMPENDWDYLLPALSYAQARTYPDCGPAAIKIGLPGRYAIDKCCHTTTRAVMSASKQLQLPAYCNPAYADVREELGKHLPARKPSTVPAILSVCRKTYDIASPLYFAQNTFSFTLCEHGVATIT